MLYGKLRDRQKGCCVTASREISLDVEEKFTSGQQLLHSNVRLTLILDICFSAVLLLVHPVIRFDGDRCDHVSVVFPLLWQHI